jgi:hypothetical protein
VGPERTRQSEIGPRKRLAGLIPLPFVRDLWRITSFSIPRTAEPAAKYWLPSCSPAPLLTTRRSHWICRVERGLLYPQQPRTCSGSCDQERQPITVLASPFSHSLGHKEENGLISPLLLKFNWDTMRPSLVLISMVLMALVVLCSGGEGGGDGSGLIYMISLLFQEPQ